MVTAKATKAADKSQVCRKLVTALQKLYGKSVPRIEMPVMETFLFAVCLEDSPWAEAEAGLKKVLASFFDLNEIRVSSVTELEHHLLPLNQAEWKAMRIRSMLRAVFESTYSYDFEKLRRQTFEQAIKTLKKFPDITPFIRDFVLHEILGSHVVVLDTSMLTAARWLGLVPAGADHDTAAEFLKGGLRKSEGPEFCHLLRCLATDPKYGPRFLDTTDQPLTMSDVMDRFVELQSPPKKKPAKPVAPPADTGKPEKSDKAPGRKPAAAATPDKAVTSGSKPAAKPAAAGKSAHPTGAKSGSGKTTASSAGAVAPPSGTRPGVKSTGEPQKTGTPRTSAKPDSAPSRTPAVKAGQTAVATRAADNKPKSGTPDKSGGKQAAQKPLPAKPSAVKTPPRKTDKKK